MIIRNLDQNGDWEFGQSLNDYVSNNAAIALDIKTRLSSFLGNCFFDLGAGIDWFNFLGGSKSLLAINLALNTVLINTPGVTGVYQASASVDPLTRSFTVVYRVQTTYSTLSNTFSYDLGGSI